MKLCFSYFRGRKSGHPANIRIGASVDGSNSTHIARMRADVPYLYLVPKPLHPLLSW